MQEFDQQLTDAKTQLGKQQERAATAEHDAADAKTISAKTNERAQALEAEAANAKLSQQKVELELGKQQERAANAERSLLELQRRVEPRRLSPEQRTRLIAVLSSGPRGPVSVTCVLGDSDGCPFAEQIKEVLTASGWTDVDGVNQAVFGGGSPIGFGIIVRSAVTAPSFAGHLQQAFFSIGLPLGGVEKADAPEGVVQIIVGHKPN